jgi:predicted Zn-dependent protease with MMP-like domain
MVEMDSAEFAALVREIYQREIPARFKDALENIALTIEDKPTGRAARSGRTLLGLYEGVPKTAPYSVFHGVQPSKITLYEQNILYYARDWRDLEALIQEVLMHEIAHYFGYGEREMVYMDARLRKKLGRRE